MTPTRQDYERAAETLEALASFEVPKPVPVTAVPIPVAALRQWASLLSAAAERMTWRPIETAPKGLCLLYFPEESGRNAKQERCAVDFYPVTYPRKPTHWLPLPEPPKEAEERPRRTYAEGYAEGVMDAIDKLDKYRDRYEEDQRKIAELRDLLEAATHEGPWVWETGGDNDLDSLTCPILITADALRDLLAPPSAEVEAERYRDSAMLHATRLGAMVRWLEAHHPEVFREGLWDAIATAEPTPQVLAALRAKGGTE